MGYFFERSESIPTAIRRILAEQLDEACCALASTNHAYLNNTNFQNSDLHNGVHNARRCFKKIQSLLYLIQGYLSSNIYDFETKRFQRLGAQLSIIRDAEAIIEAYDCLDTSPLTSSKHNEFAYQATDSLKATLEQQRDITTFSQSDVKTLMYELTKELENTKSNLELWPIIPQDFSIIAKNFSRNYKKGRRALKYVYDNPSTKGFHQWRKRVKNFEHQCCLLKECWPAFMEPRASKAKALENLLGQDHDLSVLQKTLNTKIEHFDSETHLKTTECAQQRQQQLRAKAHKIGKELFKPHPSNITQGVTTHWEYWKNQKLAPDT